MKKLDAIRAAWKKKPVGIRSAWIVGGLGLIGVAAITLPLQFCGSPTSDEQTVPVVDSELNQSVMVGNAGDINIYMMPENPVQEAVDVLMLKVAETETAVELTRQELAVLAQALQDLDERTSGIEKLPDGRTTFGNITGGYPTIVIDEHQEAYRLYVDGEFAEALVHSLNAISAYEETSQMSGGLTTGNVSLDSLAEIYRLASANSHMLDLHEQALVYATKAVEVLPSSENQAMLALTLYNLQKVDEAMAAIMAALDDDPDHSLALELRTLIEQRTTRFIRLPG